MVVPSMLIFHEQRDRFPLNYKEVMLNHDRRTPIHGYVGLRGPILTRRTRVACNQAHSGQTGAVSHDYSAQADLDGYGLRVVRNTNLKASTL